VRLGIAAPAACVLAPELELDHRVAEPAEGCHRQFARVERGVHRVPRRTAVGGELGDAIERSAPPPRAPVALEVAAQHAQRHEVTERVVGHVVQVLALVEDEVAEELASREGERVVRDHHVRTLGAAARGLGAARLAIIGARAAARLAAHQPQERVERSGPRALLERGQRTAPRKAVEVAVAVAQGEERERHPRQVIGGGQPGQRRLQTQGAPADVVAAALEHGDAQLVLVRCDAGTAQELARDRHVAIHRLFLQGARERRDADARLVAQRPEHRRHEVGEGLARTRRRVHEQEAAPADGARRFGGRGVLALAVVGIGFAAAGEVARQVLLEDLVEQAAVGLREHRLFLETRRQRRAAPFLLLEPLPARLGAVDGGFDRGPGAQGVAQLPVGQRGTRREELVGSVAPLRGVFAKP